MSDEQIIQFGTSLVNAFFDGEITPKAMLDNYCGSLAPGNAEIKKQIGTIWAQRNQERKAAGTAGLDPARPLNLSRGFGDMVAEEELKHYLPEEKIIINQDLFRRKLENVDFSNLDGATERRLLDSLRQESIGLSKDDATLYFNLIKLDYLAKKGGSAAKMAAEPAINFAETIIKLCESQFVLDKDSLTKMNTGRAVDMKLVTALVQEGIRANRVNPRVMVHYLGYATTKYIDKFKDFMRLVVSQRDGNLNEIFQHFGLYLLLNGNKPDALAKLQLTSPLETFVTDRIGRMRQIYYVAMLFAYTMTYVLFVQIYEISGKYQQAPEDQKPKLRKLYESEERLGMLVTNAANIASRKIADYKVESREVQTALKKFLAANKNLVTTTDLFGTSYEIR